MRRGRSRTEGLGVQRLVLLFAVCTALFICCLGLVLGLDDGSAAPSSPAETPASAGIRTGQVVPVGPAFTSTTLVSDTSPSTSAAPLTSAAPSTSTPSSTVTSLAAGGPDDSGSSTTPVNSAPGTPTVDVDVVVFSTQTSGLAAVRELRLAAPNLRIALVSSGKMLETPLAQGLCVEDARDIGRVAGGFYKEWRQTVIDNYGMRGISPFTVSGRLVYEPEVAVNALWSLLREEDPGSLLYYSAHLVAAGDQSDDRYADISVEGQGMVRLKTRFFIDASVEGDLARMLGASYRVGRSEAVYNDAAGIVPAYPSADNGYETAPQRFSPLLTLKIYRGANAPRLSGFAHPNYDPASYAVMPAFSQKNVDAFKNSWSMTIAVLPNSKRELNETWSDWPDVGLAFQWVFFPEKRGEIRKRVLEWSINRVRYLQEHGYPRVGIANVPQKLYVREGPRIVGLDTYTVTDLRTGAVREPVALGCYVEYDRHDIFYPNHVETTRYAELPMGALLAKGHPWLLVSTGVSTDFATYSSAVRMEHMRAAMGGAAGAIVAVAARLGVTPDQAPYNDVRAQLLAQGYRLQVAQ